MIDLHTHSTASDGRYPPAELVARASAAGVTILALTDHDTIGGFPSAAAACAAAGIDLVAGIEITAVHNGGDLHVLGYFFDVGSASLGAFLAAQRRLRLERVREMIDKLASVGIVLDADEILQPAIDDPSRSAGRPWIAKMLVSAGHVSSTNEAFDRWLEQGKPAFVPRVGATPAEVIAQIHGAGGIASLAHPVLLHHDEWIRGLAGEGLDAIEAYHSKHDERLTTAYLALARTLSLAVTGGSDYHGDPAHGPTAPGAVVLPREAYERLVQLKAQAGASRAGRS